MISSGSSIRFFNPFFGYVPGQPVLHPVVVSFLCQSIFTLCQSIEHRCSLSLMHQCTVCSTRINGL
jgi:hypothetical protein